MSFRKIFRRLRKQSVEHAKTVELAPSDLTDGDSVSVCDSVCVDSMHVDSMHAVAELAPMISDPVPGGMPNNGSVSIEKSHLFREPEEIRFEDNSPTLSIITTERLRQLTTDPGIPTEIRNFISTFVKQHGSHYIREKPTYSRSKELEVCDYGTSKITTSEVPLDIGKLIGPRYQAKVNKWLENHVEWPLQIPGPVHEQTSQVISPAWRQALEQLPVQLPLQSAIQLPTKNTTISLSRSVQKQAPVQLQPAAQLPAQLPIQSLVQPRGHFSAQRPVPSPRKVLSAHPQAQYSTQLPVMLPRLVVKQLPPAPLAVNLSRMNSVAGMSDAPSLYSSKSSCSTLSTKRDPPDQLDIALLSDFVSPALSHIKVGTVPRHSSKVTRRRHSNNIGLPCFELNNPNTYCGSAAMSGPYPCILNRKSMAMDGTYKRRSSVMPITSEYE